MRPSRRLRVLLLAILLFILHFLASIRAASALNAVLDLEGPAADRFAPTFAVALTTLPLYPILGGKVTLLALMLLNCALCAIVIALVLVHVRWRTIVTIVVAMTVLVFGGAIGAALWMERQLEVGWNELAPRAIDPVPGAQPLSSVLGDLKIESLSEYLAKEIARGDERVDPLPQDVEHFLVEYRGEIEVLRQRLLSGAPPAARDDPAPYFRMQKILLVDALRTRSWQDLDAAGRLTESMLHEPSFHSVLFAITANENQLGVARKLDFKLDPKATVSLLSFDPHQSLIDGIAAQSRPILKISGPWYALPYVRLCVAESAYSALRQARRIRALRGCRFDAPAEVEAEPWVPFNPTGVMEGGERYAIRANRLLLDREGTANVLGAKNGAAPVSRSCPDRKWVLDGNTLRLQPPVPAIAPALPGHHEISVHPASRSTS